MKGLARCGAAALVGIMLAAGCASQRSGFAPSASLGRSGFENDAEVGSAVAIGTVTDLASDAPLRGIPIFIASWKKDAMPRKVAVTDPRGRFAFRTMPGTYLLQAGDDEDRPRTAILHQKIVLATGRNDIRGETPSAVRYAVYTEAQRSGSIRLLQLNIVQSACLDGANRGRLQMHLHELVPDEYLEETAIAWNQEEGKEDTDTPKPLWGGDVSVLPISWLGAATTTGYGGIGGVLHPLQAWEAAGCPAWTYQYSYLNRFNPPYPYATNPAAIWYGADNEGIWRKWTDPGNPYAMQIWSADPRG